MRKRFLSTLIALTLTTGTASTVFASSTTNKSTNINELYKNAYTATMKSLNEKTQSSIKEAREAIGKLPKSLDWAIGEFSKQVDTVQHPIFVEIVNSIEKSKNTNKQDDINSGRELVKDVIEDQYKRTWSSDLDRVQQKKIERLIQNVNKLNVANSDALEVIEEELNDLSKVKYNNTVKNFVDTYSDQIFTKITGTKELVDKYSQIVEKKLSTEEIKQIKNCANAEKLTSILKESKADKNKMLEAAIYWINSTENADIEKLTKEVTTYNVNDEKAEKLPKENSQKEADEKKQSEENDNLSSLFKYVKEKQNKEEEKLNKLIKEKKEEEKLNVEKTQNEIQKQEEQNKEVGIKSNLLNKGIQRRGVSYQKSFLVFKMVNAKITKDQIVTVGGKTINILKGDTSSKIKDRIIKAFENDLNWESGVGYALVQEKSASVRLVSKQVKDNVDNLAIGSSEISFIQYDDTKGDIGQSEVKEKCEVVVTKSAGEDQKLTLNVKGYIANVNIGTVTINISKGNSTQKIAKSIEAAFKAHDNISRIFNISLDESNSKVILTQKMAHNLGITVEVEKVNDIERNKKSNKINPSLVKDEVVGNNSSKIDIEKENEKKVVESEELKKQQEEQKIQAEKEKAQKEAEANRLAEQQRRAEELKKQQKENQENNNLSSLYTHVKEKKDTSEEKLNKFAKEEKEKQKLDAEKAQKEIQKQEEQNKEVGIKSTLVNKGVQRRGISYQKSFLVFKMANARITEDQTITVAGKTVNILKDDTSSKIKDRIIKAFENDPNWESGVGYVLVQEKSASVKLVSKQVKDNVDNLSVGSSEISFVQYDDVRGDIGQSEVKEKCEIVVTTQASEDQTLTLNIKGYISNVNIGTVTINVSKGDTTQQIAKFIEAAFKGHSNISRIFNISLDETNSKVVLTQKIAYNLGTTVEVVK
ncbi:hypothetical protein C3495_07125 [Clostridiaceae bacterium 14S0207]|nr:hypothetical protein C3495_07125 [Clostridiaceae bacterium 14S0207]